MKICKILNCGKKHRTKGFCNKHYLQYWKYGKTFKSFYEKNLFIKEHNYIKIELLNKKGVFLGYSLIDKSSLKKVKKYKFHLTKEGYAVGILNYKLVKLSRLILDFPKNRYVDHINRDKLDNRISNLRLASHSENCANRGKSKNNKSGFKGVDFCLRYKKWRSQINNQKKKIHLGYFLDKIEAAKAYDSAAKKLHKEFAVTNF